MIPGISVTRVDFLQEQLSQIEKTLVDLEKDTKNSNYIYFKIDKRTGDYEKHTERSWFKHYSSLFIQKVMKKENELVLEGREGQEKIFSNLSDKFSKVSKKIDEINGRKRIEFDLADITGIERTLKSNKAKIQSIFENVLEKSKKIEHILTIEKIINHQWEFAKKKTLANIREEIRNLADHPTQIENIESLYPKIRDQIKEFKLIAKNIEIMKDFIPSADFQELQNLLENTQNNWNFLFLKEFERFQTNQIKLLERADDTYFATTLNPHLHIHDFTSIRSSHSKTFFEGVLTTIIKGIKKLDKTYEEQEKRLKEEKKQRELSLACVNKQVEAASRELENIESYSIEECKKLIEKHQLLIQEINDYYYKDKNKDRPFALFIQKLEQNIKKLESQINKIKIQEKNKLHKEIDSLLKEIQILTNEKIESLVKFDSIKLKDEMLKFKFVSKKIQKSKLYPLQEVERELQSFENDFLRFQKEFLQKFSIFTTVETKMRTAKNTEELRSLKSKYQPYLTTHVPAIQKLIESQEIQETVKEIPLFEGFLPRLKEKFKQIDQEIEALIQTKEEEETPKQTLEIQARTGISSEAAKPTLKKETRTFDSLQSSLDQVFEREEYQELLSDFYSSELYESIDKLTNLHDIRQLAKTTKIFQDYREERTGLSIESALKTSSKSESQTFSQGLASFFSFKKTSRETFASAEIVVQDQNQLKKELENLNSLIKELEKILIIRNRLNK